MSLIFAAWKILSFPKVITFLLLLRHLLFSLYWKGRESSVKKRKSSFLLSLIFLSLAFNILFINCVTESMEGGREGGKGREKDKVVQNVSHTYIDFFFFSKTNFLLKSSKETDGKELIPWKLLILFWRWLKEHFSFKGFFFYF